ncbi:MAG: DUF2167 domain-containing protein [Granulosicoccus sp.]
MKLIQLAGTASLVLASLIPTPFVLAQAADAINTDEEYVAWATEFLTSLDMQSGDIDLYQAGATLRVPDNYYYLNPADAEKVLVDAWENPPGSNTLGMLFPTRVSPLDDNAWAVTIDYEEDGYVSDENADDIDYSELLFEMQKDIRAGNEQRQKSGYDTVELIGWAADPYYDASAKKLHWAKELKFGSGEDINTLNYNIRVLGRKGVLVLNFIAGMDQKSLVNAELGTVLAMADFNQGSSYADFDPDLDKVAAYGIGALIAGKVIAKTGFLVVALVFLKKFGILLLLAAFVFFKKLFSRRPAT